MKVIYWLWNPFQRHQNNRHNAWYLFLDHIANFYNNKSKFTRDYKNQLYIKELVKWELILAKSTINMNDQWISVYNIKQIYDLDIEKDILIVQDDLDYEIWKFVFKKKSSPTHNWILSINKYIWLNYRKLRIWVENRVNKEISSKHYLLSDFDITEKEIINKAFNNIILTLNLWINWKLQ